MVTKDKAARMHRALDKALDAVAVNYKYSTPPKTHKIYSILNKEDLAALTAKGGSKLRDAAEDYDPNAAERGMFYGIAQHAAKQKRKAAARKAAKTRKKNAKARAEDAAASHKFEKMPGNKPGAPCNRCLESKTHPNHDVPKKAKDAGWVTNDPEHAAALRKADKKYEAAKQAASRLPLAAKIEALRKAKEERQAAYNAVVCKDSSPFDRDTDYGCAQIVLRDTASGSKPADIVKKYGFDLRFVKDVLAGKYGPKAEKLKGTDVKPV